MNREQLTYRDESLTAKEKSTLIKRFVVVLLFASAMGFFIVWFMHFFDADGSFGAIPIVFECFFFAILLFIVGVHGVNAFQSKKRIYTGTITDKYERSTKFKSSNQSQSFYIKLDDVEFSVEQFIFDKCFKGSRVELLVLGKSRIFDVHLLDHIPSEISEDDAHPVHHTRQHAAHQASILTNKYKDLREVFTPEQRDYLRKKLIRAAIVRGIIGAIGGFIAYFVLLVLMIMFVPKSILHEYIKWLYYGIIALSWLVFALVNLRTYHLIRDLLLSHSVCVIETALDLERSNMPKPGRRSIVTYQGYYYRDDLFYYLRTRSFWIQITPELYEQVQSGDPVVIQYTKHTRLVLEVLVS